MPATRGHVRGSRTLQKSFAGSGQGGPCLTDAARGAASGRAVRGVPLRRGPNDAAAIIAAKLARWRHVLSSCFGPWPLSAALRARSRERCKCLSVRPSGQSLLDCSIASLPCAHVGSAKNFLHSLVLSARGGSLLGTRAHVGPDLADLLVADHAFPRRHLALAVPHPLVEMR